MNKMPNIIDGQQIAQNIIRDTAAKVAKFHEANNIRPGLVVILVGDNPASAVYVARKEDVAREIGFNFTLKKLPNSASQGDVVRCIQGYNTQQDCHGILVQLPLPKHINAMEVLSSVSPSKDVDGLHPHNFGRMAMGLPALYPCTALAIMDCINSCVPHLKGLNVAIIGKSNLVGKPLGIMLSNMDATVTLCHKDTQNIKQYTQNAQIVVVAIGVPGYITQDFLQEGATVIDVGITIVDDVATGDVLFDDVAPKVKNITPVPKGVGPITVARLMANTLDAMVNIWTNSNSNAQGTP